MLKNNKHSLMKTFHVLFFCAVSSWEGRFSVYRFLSPVLFWFNTQQKWLFFLTQKKFFFFKFLKLKKKRQLHKKKTRSLLRMGRHHLKKIFRKSKVRLIKWCQHKISKQKRFIPKRKHWIKRHLTFKKWSKTLFKKSFNYRIKRPFHKLLKQRIATSQFFLSSFFFIPNKKHIIKKLFSLARGHYNTGVFFKFFYKRFYFATYFKSFWFKYNGVLQLTKIFNSKNQSILHVSILNWLFFKKSKINHYMRVRYKRRMSLFLRRRLKRYRRRKGYRHFKRFKTHYKIFPRVALKSSVMHIDRMSKLYWLNLNYMNLFGYYINYIINIWNIRSYNWKQIT